MFPNPLNGGIRAARLQQNSDSGNLSIAGFVHQVDHHIVWLALNILFTGAVKVELL
jgi:hypothetical protein